MSPVNVATKLTGKGKQSVTSRVCPMSKPNNCPVTRDGMLSLQCFKILRTANPSSCTFLSGDESVLFSIAAAKLMGAPSAAIVAITRM